MIGKEVRAARAATLAEVAEILAQRKGEGELGFEQAATLEHAQKFARLPADKAAKLVAELGRIERVSPDAAAKIADLLPKNAVELALVFAKERYALGEKEIEEVLSIVQKYR
ncbi:MAG: RNA polymerase Rpb4 family protein [Candidatus Micrarchaeia archaeon]